MPRLDSDAFQPLEWRARIPAPRVSRRLRRLIGRSAAQSFSYRAGLQKQLVQRPVAPTLRLRPTLEEGHGRRPIEKSLGPLPRGFAGKTQQEAANGI